MWLHFLFLHLIHECVLLQRRLLRDAVLLLLMASWIFKAKLLLLLTNTVHGLLLLVLNAL